MSERMLLTGRCQRRTHEMFRVLDTAGGPVIEAPLYCAGRQWQTWTPVRRPGGMRPGGDRHR